MPEAIQLMGGGGGDDWDSKPGGPNLQSLSSPPRHRKLARSEGVGGSRERG